MAYVSVIFQHWHCIAVAEFKAKGEKVPPNAIQLTVIKPFREKPSLGYILYKSNATLILHTKRISLQHLAAL